MALSPYQQVYSTTFRTSSHKFGEIPPLWTVDFDDEKAILDWFKKAIDGLKEDHRERSFIQLRNRDFYAAIQSPSLGRTGIPRDREGREVTSTTSRIVVNKCYNLVELWVSKLTRFSPAVAVLPANNEYTDRVSAELGKLIIDNVFYQADIDDLLEFIVRCSRIFGEMYIFSEWDKDKGDYLFSPAERKAVYGEDAKYDVFRTPLTDEKGEAIMGKDGNPLMLDATKRIGDVDLNAVYPWFVWEEPKTYYKDVDWCIKQSFAYIDELKADYPDKAGELKTGSFGPLDISYTFLEDNEVPVFEIYHRSTRFLDSGRYIKLTPDAVLENRALPYSHGQLPRVRLTNIDVPGELRGVSLFNNILLLQVMLNNLYSLAYTNISLGSHAYWLVPSQANISKDKIKNSATVLSYTAPYTPKLEVFKTVGSEVFQMIQEVSSRIVELSGHQGLSQGDPPPGVDAAIALGVLEEQEQQRANSDIKKYNSFIRKLAKLTLATAQDNYKSEDGRLLRIVGKNGQDRIKALDMAKFAGPYDIKVQRSTALSESKTARLQQLMLIKQNWPMAVSDKRMIDLMELADEQKLYDIVSVAVRTSEAENEKFHSGEQVLEPTEYEDHFTHWDVHMQFIQSLSFKEDVPDELKQGLFDHILVHEGEMFTTASKSLAYATKLLGVEQYPAFYALPIPIPQLIAWFNQGIDPNKMLSGQMLPPMDPLTPPGGDVPSSEQEVPEDTNPDNEPLENSEIDAEAEPSGMTTPQGQAPLDVNLNIKGEGGGRQKIVFSKDEQGNRVARIVDDNPEVSEG